MAKKFVGFKPETLQKKVLPALGYNGPMDNKSINLFLASNPSAAARMGKFTLAARRTIEGNPVKMMADGGVTISSGANIMTKAITSDPRNLTIKAETDADTGVGTGITTGTGQAGDASTAGMTTAIPSTDAVAAPITQPSTIEESATAAPAVDTALSGVTAATGTVSEDATTTAAVADPTQLAQLDLQAAQGEAAKVEDAPTRVVEAGEMIDGSAVDQTKVQDIYGTQKLEAASVKDELSSLMADFEGGATPVWAAGAMRTATATMAARGLGASSLAGMAIVQAAMESALPIAQMDASNKQEVAMESARQRAGFLNMEFTQDFQAKVQNASRISEIANMNFTAQQQVALENAKMAQTMNLENLSNRQAKVMADAAAMSQIDLTNLNNRQQAQVQNAQAFLQMDMANLSNEQQTSMFVAQQRVNTILSDTAQENAAKQFNATSENQTNQFFATLATQVSQFNSEQNNAMSRFNAGEANALAKFNSDQENARDQFNATNHLVVAQANAQWAQSVTTAENAANNQANRDAALVANNLTMTAYNNMVQRERDVLAWAWQSGENAAQRDANIAISKIQAEASAAAGGNTDSSGLSAASGSFLGAIAVNAADVLFGK